MNMTNLKHAAEIVSIQRPRRENEPITVTFELTSPGIDPVEMTVMLGFLVMPASILLVALG
jgi:hypothetical protein